MSASAKHKLNSPRIVVNLQCIEGTRQFAFSLEAQDLEA